MPRLPVLRTAARLLSAPAALLALAWGAPADALEFELYYEDAAADGNQLLTDDEKAVFEAAADAWEAYLIDDIVVPVFVVHRDIGEGTLGVAHNVVVRLYDGNLPGRAYREVTNLLQLNNAQEHAAHNSAGLDPFLANYYNMANQFPNQNKLEAFLPEDADERLDGGEDWVPESIEMSIANADAIWIDAQARRINSYGYLTSVDYLPFDVPQGVYGVITMNTTTDWDLDRSDGISGYDYQATAMHELGHVLGIASNLNDLNYGSWSPYWMTMMDMFRFPYSRFDEWSGAQDFRDQPRAWTHPIDGDYWHNDAFVADLTDGGAPRWFLMANGSYSSPSHLSYFALSNDGSVQALMGPFGFPGVQKDIGILELVLLDAIGYNVAYDGDAATSAQTTPGNGGNGNGGGNGGGNGSGNSQESASIEELAADLGVELEISLEEIEESWDEHEHAAAELAADPPAPGAGEEIQ